MLMSGKEYLQSIRDGRIIYVGKERVKDQTTHPAFADGARTYAALFDMKSDPALRDVMTFEEAGERYSMYYLQPRSQEDLRRRNRAHRKIADFCFGLMGRTPDAFAGNLTGLSMKPEVFDSEPGGSRNNLLTIYRAHPAKRPVRNLRDRPAARGAQQGLLSGQGAAATGAAGDRGRRQGRHAQRNEDAGERRRLCARGADRKRDAARPRPAQRIITCVIPLNLPGLTLWSREPFNRLG